MKKLTPNTVEFLFKIGVGVLGMSNDISKTTTHIEPIAGNGYFFTWSPSCEAQPKAYSKASNGSILALPDEGKTLVAYKAISTLQSFYTIEAKQIEGKTKKTLEAIVEAITYGQNQKNTQKLAKQLAALDTACTES